jgi:hypothetical protein
VPVPSRSASRTRVGWEAIGALEPRAGVHHDLGAEAAVALVGPIHDLAVADAHQILQAIAGHVGEEHAAVHAAEDQRGAALGVVRQRDALGRAPSLACRGSGTTRGDRPG